MVLRSARAARQQNVGVSRLPTANSTCGAALAIARTVLSGASPSSPGSRLGATDRACPLKCPVRPERAGRDRVQRDGRGTAGRHGPNFGGCRWGDYSAGAVANGRIFMATEMIPQGFRDNLGNFGAFIWSAPAP